MTARERERADVAADRAAWQETMPGLDPSKLVFEHFRRWFARQTMPDVLYLFDLRARRLPKVVTP